MGSHFPCARYAHHWQSPKTGIEPKQQPLKSPLSSRKEIIMGDVMTAVVFVIDNDPSMRAALEELVGSLDLAVRVFASPLEFLASELPDVPGCLVLDVRLPGISGLTFQKELAKMGLDLPVIFITGHGDIRTSVSGDEGRRRRLPHQALPGSGHARCDPRGA